jgi:hypothetical protein
MLYMYIYVHLTRKLVISWEHWHINDYIKRISVRRTTSETVHVHCIGCRNQIYLVLKEHLVLKKK